MSTTTKKFRHLSGPLVWPAIELSFWIQEYHIDGIRYDAAKQIWQLRLHGLEWWMKPSKIAGPKPFINIAERIPETAEITNDDGPMDSCWHTSFYHTMVDLLCQGQYDAERLKDVLAPPTPGIFGRD